MSSQPQSGPDDLLPPAIRSSRTGPGFGGSAGSARNEVSLELRKKEVMRFLLERNSLKEISLITGYSYQTIRNYCSDPIFQNELRNYSKEVWDEVLKEVGARNRTAAERINELSMEALDRMESLIDKGGDNVAYKACQDILDRNSEIPRNRRVEADVTQKVFDPAALLHAANVARELDQAYGDSSTPPPPTIEQSGAD